MTDSRGRPSESTGHSSVRLSVPEMDCPTCAGKVESSVEGLDGVVEIEADPTRGHLRVLYDSTTVDADDVRHRVEAAGYAVEDDATTITLSVPEMDCPSCAGKVESALADCQGVRERHLDPTTGRVTLSYDDRQTTPAALVAAVERAGYDVEQADEHGSATGDVDSPHDVWTTPRAYKTWTGALLLAVGLLVGVAVPSLDVPLLAALGRTFTLSDGLLVAAAVVGGWAVLRAGFYSVRTRTVDVDLLMSAGILGAIAAGFFFEAATLAVLYSLAELLERFSMERARSSVSQLLDLSPVEATVRRDGEEYVVPVEDLVVGDVVVVRPGEQIPADGVVIEGQGAVDQSPITGESVPIGKAVGDEVYAGTVDRDGFLVVEVTARADESTLARIVELVADAGRDQTQREQFVDRFAQFYTPAVVVGAILVAAGPPLAFGAAWQVWFPRGLALLVLACPCAFVISTPVSVVSGITSAARNGVLIKGGPALEAMGAVDAIAFDKTGTLTTGDLSVTDVVPLGEADEDTVLARAAALERRSEHPIGRAIVAHANERGVGLADGTIRKFEALTGEGVSATLDGVTYTVGKPGLFDEAGFDLGHLHRTDGGALDQPERVDGDVDTRCERDDCVDLAGDLVPRLQREGKTVVLVGTDETVLGAIAVADTVRPAAGAVVERLHEQGVEHVVLLTGDNERTAAVVAEAVGVDEYEAGLLPEEKVDAIQDLERRFGTVAMVGDGVNDAPALAAASVGVAMGAAGTDAAIETADVALMADDLHALAYLHRLSRKANAVIRQNIGVSLGAKALLALGVPFGLVQVVHAVVIGDMGMSLLVTGNAMRLAGIEPDADEPRSSRTHHD